MGLKKIIANSILKLRGWEIVGSIPPEIKKCVIIVAPHTAIEDFIIGRLAYWKLGIPVKFLIKIEFFKTPILRYFLLKMGGIPVDRGKRNHMVEYVANLFDKSDVLNVVITPEGTRKCVKRWKKGFYFIALKAKIPVVLGFLDFKKKIGGFGPVLYPSGSYFADFKIIEEFYKDKTAKFPEKFNLDPMYRRN